MKRRGQVTIFIIIAIILVATVASFFAIKSGLLKNIFVPEANKIYLFVEECIEEVGTEAIYSIGQTGGYFFPPEFSTDSGIPYYYSNDESYIPSKEDIEKEISYYVNEMLFFCTRNFVDFPDFNITQREIKTETKIMDDKVVLNVEYPISVSKGESTSVFKDFKNIEIPVRFGVVYNAIEEIIEEQSSHDDICLSCILDVSLKNDLYVDMREDYEGVIIFVVKDENFYINNAPFEFIFANKYEIK